MVIKEMRKLAAGARDEWFAITGVEEDEAVPAFLEAWCKIAVLVGTTVVTGAVSLARARPILTKENLGLRRTPSYIHLLNVCLYLQAERGDGFFLSCRTAADIIGANNHILGWRMLNLAVEDGFLTVLRRGHTGAPGSQATRYRANLDRVPEEVSIRPLE